MQHLTTVQHRTEDAIQAILSTNNTHTKLKAYQRVVVFFINPAKKRSMAILFTHKILQFVAHRSQ